MANYSSSPSLSSPPSGSISDPGSPLRRNPNQTSLAMGDEIIVDTAARFRLMQPPMPEEQPSVPMTSKGVPRKKPGRKPGAAAAARAEALAAAGAAGQNPANPPAADAVPKQRKPRKPKDPNAPPIQRKRKVPPTEAEGPADRDPRSFSLSEPARQPKIELTSMRMDLDPPQRPSHLQHPHHNQPPAPQPQQQTLTQSHNAPVKRESLHSILNHDPPPPPRPAPVQHSPPPARTSGQSYDPVRSSNYDPVRETMMSRDPYGTGALGSPRGPTQMPNRASASPSIASLVDPPASTGTMRSPPVPASQAYNHHSDNASAPTSPSNTLRNAPPPAPPVPAPSAQSMFGPTSRTSLPASEAKSSKNLIENQAPTPLHDVKEAKPVKETKAKEPKAAKESKRQSLSSNARKPTPPKAADATGTKSSASTASGKNGAATTAASATSKKVASVVLQERKAQKANSAASSPKVSSTIKEVVMPPVPDFPDNGNEKSILDFGKMEQKQAPSIVLHIPLNGETNKYINFMRMAEEKYGWDALHPREAAHRDRKARIAAAASALEKNGSSRESGDEASDDVMSDVENSNIENGGAAGAAGASGPEGAAADKPKKRRQRADDYDKDDGFVDDSELLWEAQAAASKDGFFVYLGPLVQEQEKPTPSDGPPKRGRGSRGGRGGTGRGGGPGSRGGRGGGPGSRGGTTTRKPRITKLEKLALEQEKADREKQAQMLKSGLSQSMTVGSNNPPSASMQIDI